tara:strand:+ start:112 stop:828 length:717 start_codon:yes stop_codon:yes gene_type:complete
MMNFLKDIGLRLQMEEGGLLGDLDKDGKMSGYEQARQDAIEKSMREQKQEGGPMEKEMDELMPTADKDMVPDEEMEDNYMDFIIKEALTEEEEDMLLNKLQEDNELMMLFDKVIDVAQEFAGSGPVEGPGSGVSDSIPARLSDGEFVMTAKSVDTLGSDNLQAMMDRAEMVADRKAMQEGGPVDEEENMMQDNVKVIEQNINVSRPQTQDTPRMIEDNDLVKEELTKLSLYDRPHVRS